MKRILVNKKVGKTLNCVQSNAKKKTANIVDIFANSSSVTFSRLVAHFCCGQNVRILTKGDITEKYKKYIPLKK